MLAYVLIIHCIDKDTTAVKLFYSHPKYKASGLLKIYALLYVAECGAWVV